MVSVTPSGAGRNFPMSMRLFLAALFFFVFLLSSVAFASASASDLSSTSQPPVSYSWMTKPEDSATEQSDAHAAKQRKSRERRPRSNDRDAMEGMHSRIFQLEQQEHLRVLLREKRREIDALEGLVAMIRNGEGVILPTESAANAPPPTINGGAPSDDALFSVIGSLFDASATQYHSDEDLLSSILNVGGSGSSTLASLVSSDFRLALKGTKGSLAAKEKLLDDLRTAEMILQSKLDRRFGDENEEHVVDGTIRAKQLSSRKYNRDEHIATVNDVVDGAGNNKKKAKSMYVSFEILSSSSDGDSNGVCSGRVVSARYLPDDVPSYINWVPLPTEKAPSAADDVSIDFASSPNKTSSVLYNLVKALPEGALAATADYSPKQAMSRKGPGLFMLRTDRTADSSDNNANGRGPLATQQPYGYFFVDPRYIHVHDPDRAPQTEEEAAAALDAADAERKQSDAEQGDDDDEGHSHDHHAHNGAHHGGGGRGGRAQTDTYYVQESGTVDLWVPAGTQYIYLYCDVIYRRSGDGERARGNFSSAPPHIQPLRVPIPSPSQLLPSSAEEAAANRRRMAGQADEGGTEYQEIHVVGPPDRVLNIVFVAGAYLESGRAAFFEQARNVYDILVDKEMDNLFNGEMDDPSHDMHASVPHNRYLNFWNVFAVFQPSNEEGPSRPAIGKTTDNNLRCVHPAEMERGLQCNWDLARALAAVAPVNMNGKPGRTLVITLVNSPIYGGTGLHIFGVRNFCSFFNGYDLSDVQQKQRMISLMDHEIGHALGGVLDEYLAYDSTTEADRPYANCQKGYGPSNSPPGTNELRWKWWLDKYLASPATFFSTWGDRLRSTAAATNWKMLQTPTANCLYRNYYRPTDFCLMYRLADYGMCPVCREACTVTQMRLGFDLQYPRKPLEDQVVIVLTNTSDKNVLNVNSNFTVHLSRTLTPANHFAVSMKDVDGADIPLTTEDASLCPACFVLRAANFAKYPIGEIVTLTVTITDNTLFVQSPTQRAAVTADQPSQFQQTAEFRFLVTDRSPSTFSTAASSSHQFSTQDAPIANVSFVSRGSESEVGTSRYDFVGYYASCNPADGSSEGLCSMNFTNNVYTTPTKLDDDLSQYDLWAVAIVVIIAVIFLIGWGYQCVRNRSRERGVVRPIFKVQFGVMIRIIRFLMLATAVCLMFASIVTLGLSGYYYTKLSVLGKLVIYVGIGVSVPLYFLAYVGYSAVASRSKRWLMVNGLLLLIALGATLALFVIVNNFVTNVKDGDGSELSWMADYWKGEVTDDPEQLCKIQNELRCTGWNQSCIAVFGVTDECPENCDVINNKYAYACGALVTDLIVEYGPYVVYILGVGVAMLVIGIGFDIISWISLFMMKLAIRNKNKAKILTQSKSNPSFHAKNASSKDHKKYGALLLLMSLGSNDTRQLTREFKRIDKDGSGTLDKLEMLLFFKKALCYKPTEAEINEIFAIADVDNDRSINLREFLSLFSTAGGNSTNRSTMIIRQRLAERGLLSQVEMAHRSALEKQQHHPSSPPASPMNADSLQQPMMSHAPPPAVPMRQAQFPTAGAGAGRGGMYAPAAAQLQVPALPRTTSNTSTPRGGRGGAARGGGSRRPAPQMLDEDISFHL